MKWNRTCLAPIFMGAALGVIAASAVELIAGDIRATTTSAEMEVSPGLVEQLLVWPPVPKDGAQGTIALCGPAAYAYNRHVPADSRYAWCVLYGNAVVDAIPLVGDGTGVEKRWWAAQFVAAHVGTHGFGNPAWDVGLILNEIEPYLFQ